MTPEFKATLASRMAMKREESAHYRAYQWCLTRFFGGLFILFVFAVLFPGCLAMRKKHPNGKESA